MGKHENLYEHILLRRSDAGISFESLCSLLEYLGFDRRIRGDHHIFSKAGIDEILNLQPRSGKAKPYQVKQVRGILLQYQIRPREQTDE